jgi:hypothetical protein
MGGTRYLRMTAVVKGQEQDSHVRERARMTAVVKGDGTRQPWWKNKIYEDDSRGEGTRKKTAVVKGQGTRQPW